MSADRPERDEERKKLDAGECKVVLRAIFGKKRKKKRGAKWTCPS
jgi:hypothetical protein